MYMSYNCQYSSFNLDCIFIYIVNVIYGISYVATNAPDSTILSRRYDIPFGYSDILFMTINIMNYNLLSN